MRREYVSTIEREGEESTFVRLRREYISTAERERVKERE